MCRSPRHAREPDGRAAPAAEGLRDQRLVGAILLEQNDERALQRRYMSLETLAPISDVPTVSLPAVTA